MPLSPYIAGLRERIGDDLILLPGVRAVIVDDANRVLLARRSDTGRWHPIGGGVEPGEDPAEACRREVLEETGLTVDIVRLTGVYTSPEVVYPNGHRVRYVSTVFRCRPAAGEARVADDEATEVRWFAPDEIPDIRPDVDRSLRHALSEDDRADFL